MSNNNMLVIAKKEFGDLLGSKMIIITIAVFLILVVFSINDFYSGASTGKILNFYSAATGSILYVLIGYGAIVGIIIGVTSVSNERRNHALNVLISKPLYRDTIINGKLLGSICALACIFGLIIAFYTAGLLLVCGGMIAPILFDYAIRLPFELILAIIYVMIFLSLAMFISIMVKDYAVSIIMSLIAWSLLLFIQNANFAVNIASLFPGDYDNTVDLITDFSPHTMIDLIGNSKFFDQSINIMEGLNSMSFQVIELLVYLLIAIMICYLAFIKRDIQ
jgi:ABC-2 type transport system permease protein